MNWQSGGANGGELPHTSERMLVVIDGYITIGLQRDGFPMHWEQVDWWALESDVVETLPEKVK